MTWEAIKQKFNEGQHVEPPIAVSEQQKETVALDHRALRKTITKGVLVGLIYWTLLLTGISILVVIVYAVMGGR